MPTEYHLQKRGLAVWQYVTWYRTYEEAKPNFDKLVKGQGWSYRIVKQEVMDEALLDGEFKDDGPVDEEPIAAVTGEFKSTWGAPDASGLNKPAGEAGLKSEHGLTGSVWVGNPVTKEKRRVVGFEAAKMLNEGWIKAGPRTVL